MVETNRIHPDLYKLITKFTACDDDIDGGGSNCESEYFEEMHPFVKSQKGLSENWQVALNFWIQLRGLRDEKIDSAVGPVVKLLQQPTDAESFLSALKATKHPLQEPIRDCVKKGNENLEPLDECFASILIDSGTVPKTTARKRYERLQDPNNGLEDPSDFSLMNARTASNHTDLFVFFGMLALAYPGEKNPFK